LADFTFPQPYIFADFQLNFSSPDFENVSDFTLFISQIFIFETMDFLPCWHLQMVHTKSVFCRLADAWLQVIRAFIL
jgi:hypothetical protein